MQSSKSKTSALQNSSYHSWGRLLKGPIEMFDRLRTVFEGLSSSFTCFGHCEGDTVGLHSAMKQKPEAFKGVPMSTSSCRNYSVLPSCLCVLLFVGATYKVFVYFPCFEAVYQNSKNSRSGGSHHAPAGVVRR